MWTRKGVRTGLATIMSAGLLLLMTACGGSSGSAGDGVATAGGDGASGKDDGAKGDGKTNPQDAALAFAQCMRDHGVDVPDPEPGDGGFIRMAPGEGSQELEGPVNDEAEKACRHFLEDMIPEGAAPSDPAEQDRALKFSQCMREHGVDLPDPDFSKGGITVQLGEGLDPTSPTFKAAEEACREFFGPGRGPASEAGPVPRITGGGE